MIRGGSSAAGKTGAIMTGYTQFYQPCEVIVYSKTVQQQIQRKKTTAYGVYVTIEDFDGNEIVLNSCSYVQVQKYSSTGIDTAYMTLQKPEVWSIWGDDYTEIIRPSKRSCTVYAGLPGKEIILIRGRIIGAAEMAGGNGGAINVNITDHRATLRRITPQTLKYARSRYCEAHRLAFPTFAPAQLPLVIHDTDVISMFAPAQNNLESMESAVSGAPEWVGGDLMEVGSPSGHEIIGSDLLLIDDSMITYASREFYDSNAFNAVNVIGIKSGFVVNDEVRNDVDIGKRGKIVATSVMGSEDDDLDFVKELAERAIQRSLRGRFSANTTFLPYLVPGQIIRFQSTRFKIAETTAKVRMVRHQYSHGNDITALDGLEVVT